MTLEGVLPVCKPVDFTSHDVVAKVRRMTGVRRIGHTGTLDPKVTGVLPLCIGRATRMVEYIQDLPKEYEAELTIGYATDTEDATGSVIERVQKVELTEEEVISAILSFQGVIEQVPPMYSAVKVDGRRLYELAREGKDVERKARRVEIYRIELLGMERSGEYPVIRFRCLCSKGTYIRTLCADIGRKLGYPAVMSNLIRTSSGSITLDRCLTLERIAELSEKGELAEYLIPADQAVSHLPSFVLPGKEALQALQGRTVAATMASNANESGTGIHRLYSEEGQFLGLFQWNEAGSVFTPVKVFN